MTEELQRKFRYTCLRAARYHTYYCSSSNNDRGNAFHTRCEFLRDFCFFFCCFTTINIDKKKKNS